MTATFSHRDTWPCPFGWDAASGVEQLVLGEIHDPGATRVAASLCDRTTITGSSVGEVQEHATQGVRHLQMHYPGPEWRSSPWICAEIHFDAVAGRVEAEVQGDDLTRVRGLMSRLEDEAKRATGARRGLFRTIFSNPWVFTIATGVVASLIAAGIVALA
jgi:hypothetical protein